MAKKTFPYAVIWGGEIIPANTPIEVEEEVNSEETEETETEETETEETETEETEKPKKNTKKKAAE